MLQGGETFGFAFKVGPLMLGTDYMFFGNNSKHVNAFIGFLFLWERGRYKSYEATSYK